jgi:dTDP-4-amino-4,6-dideoxygalactose transaminase
MSSSFTPDQIERTALAAATWVREAYVPGSSQATAHWRGDGPVGELEARLRDHYAVPHALTMSSATNALLALALSCDLAESEIIVPPDSYGATYGPFAWLGCKLRRADPNTDGNISPESVERLLTSSTKAVLAADYQGRPHDHRALRRICDKHRLLYFSDAASSLGWQREELPASSLADAWVVSFGMSKPVPAGEGAAILTRDAALYRRLLHLTQHPERWRREVSLSEWNAEPFINARMHPLSAVITLALWPADQSEPDYIDLTAIRDFPVLTAKTGNGFEARRDQPKNKTQKETKL